MARSLPAATPLPRLSWRDIILFCGFFLTLFAALHVAMGMAAPFSPERPPVISLDPHWLPWYAARSLLRMYLAFAASLVFTLIYGYLAAYRPRAEAIMLSLLDILQSVPVLGFLAITVTGFMALFPHSLLGLEAASIFAIFTSQAWNLTFSFYQSLKLLPEDLREAGAVYGLTPWHRLVKLELPSATIGLVWNGMMSFGGGWFFLAASEAISVLGHHYALPGVGSYMAAAVEVGNLPAVGWAVLTMVILVVLVDQLFWRPIVAWAQRFKFEEGKGAEEPTSWLLDWIRHSQLLPWLQDRALRPVATRLDAWLSRASARLVARPLPAGLRQALSLLVKVALVGLLIWGFVHGGIVLSGQVSLGLILKVLGLGALTLLRVVAVVVISSVIWIPIGVLIGFSPRLARVAQPLVQIGASFPANLLFPIIVLGFIQFRIPLSWGSLGLLMLGTQWYILFNVIAGAMEVPSDLREAARTFQLGGWHRWRTLILPAIFPAWVTGALTAAGGAWNASIVAEIASWGQHTLVAPGLGQFVAEATEAGDWPGILLGIATMSAYIVVLNRIVWRPLQRLAETR